MPSVYPFSIEVQSSAQTAGFERAAAAQAELKKEAQAVNAELAKQFNGGTERADGRMLPTWEEKLAELSARKDGAKPAAQAAGLADVAPQAAAAAESIAGLAARFAVLGTAAAAVGQVFRLAWGDNEKLRGAFGSLGETLSGIAKGALQDVIGKGEGLRSTLDGVTRALGGETSAQRELNDALAAYVGAGAKALTATEQLNAAKAESARLSRLSAAADAENKAAQDAGEDIAHQQRLIDHAATLKQIKADSSLTEEERRKRLAEAADDFDEQEALAAKTRLATEEELTERSRQRAQLEKQQADARLQKLKEEAEAHAKLDAARLLVKSANERRRTGEGLADDAWKAEENLAKVQEQYAGKFKPNYNADEQKAAIKQAEADAKAAREAADKADSDAAAQGSKRTAKEAEIDTKLETQRSKRKEELDAADAKDKAKAEEEQKGTEDEDAALSDFMESMIKEAVDDQDKQTEEAKDKTDKKADSAKEDRKAKSARDDKEEDAHHERRLQRLRARGGDMMQAAQTLNSQQGAARDRAESEANKPLRATANTGPDRALLAGALTPGAARYSGDLNEQAKDAMAQIVSAVEANHGGLTGGMFQALGRLRTYGRMMREQQRLTDLGMRALGISADERTPLDDSGRALDI